MKWFKFLTEKKCAFTKQDLYDKYYKDYPEKPYISDARNISVWMEQMELSPSKNIIPKYIMRRYPDGLLPGHICMLYWIKRHPKDSIPSFFEYKYGIDFQKEKQFLIQNKLLDTSLHLTNLGEEAIQRHRSVIDSDSSLKKHKNKDGFSTNQSTSFTHNNRLNLPSEYIDSMQAIEASEDYKSKLYDSFYWDYPELPFISKDRELNTNWIEQAKMFPKQSLVPKSMMKRYADGLLPGHIYMLYWLNKYTNKKVPAYFEYKYGINFNEEKLFLEKAGYLFNDKPTEKGEASIQKHYSVIKMHSPKKAVFSRENTEKQILILKEDIKKNGFSKYKYIASSNCCPECRKLNGKIFPISQLKPGINAPPICDRCICSIVAYMDEDNYTEWLDTYSEHRMDFEHWKNRKRT